MTDEEPILEDDPVIEYGTVNITVTDSDDNPIKNALVVLGSVGRVTTDRTGECTIEDVPYGEYSLVVGHTGYETEIDTITVDDATIDLTVTLTKLPDDPNTIEVDLDDRYTFTISESVTPEYGVSTQVLEWLHDNLASLKDDSNKAIFGKVNYGFNDNTIKTFGKKPVCDVYIDKVEYDGDFDGHTPIKVHTIVIFYMKGANNQTYLKATELHDLIMQEFITNTSFKLLDDVVQGTIIKDSGLRNQSIRGGYGVLGTFELSHDLYY